MNRVGEKYNKLTIINKGEKGFYKCKCECGNETVVYITRLKSGWTKSCGCNKLKRNRDLKLKEELGYGVSMFNEVLRSYKKSAKYRNIDFDLSTDEFLDVITKPCNYCGDELTNIKKTKDCYGEFRYTGIDRYDNDKGYIIDNVVPCCKNCNTMKLNLSVEDFYLQIEKIHNKYVKNIS